MTGEKWKSFWLGTFAAIAVGVLAGIVMNTTGVSSGEKFSTSSTRL